jgi:hypothetical protein
MISCFTSLIPKLIAVEIAGDDGGFAGEALGWGSSYRVREKRKKGNLQRGRGEHRGHREERKKRRDISSLTKTVSDGAEVLFAQADTFAGANVKEKASACSVRNNRGLLLTML